MAGKEAPSVRERLLDGLFGDRLGLALFLGVVCVAAVYWRAGLFITDNATLARTLGALADGRLWIEPATQGHFDAPGTIVQDGLVFGRNYGQVALAVPFLWALWALDAVANLHVALVALWHLLVLWLVVLVGRLRDRERLATLGGSAVVLLSFLVNVALAVQFTDLSVPLLALQLSTLVAAGLCAVVLYRLVAWQHDRRLGVLAGGAAVLALPLGFWATIPKRHVLVALLCLAVLYLFARSREPDRRRLPLVGPVPARRAGMYALVGLLAWIHAAEGLFVFLAVVALDVPTAPANDRRTMAILGVAFVASLLPFFATNYLVSGDVARPPRALYAGVATEQAGGAGGGGLLSGGGGTGGGGTGGGGGSGLLSPLLSPLLNSFVVETFAWVGSTTLTITSNGLWSLLQVDDVYHTFVRSSGRAIEGNARFRGVNLAVLESAPLLAATVVAAGGTLAGLATAPRRLLGRVSATDALAGLLVAAFVVIYSSRLPLQVQLTVRYLLPVYPLALYLLVRSSLVRRVVEGAVRPMLWTYALGVLVGGQLLFVYTTTRNLAVAEATQVHALLALALAALVLAALAASAVDERFRTAAGVALGLAAAAGTVFVLLSGLDYFGFVGDYVLPVAGRIHDLLALA